MTSLPSTITVAPGNTQNTHHVKLSRGSDTLGLILCDAAGNADPHSVQRNPYPRSALQMYSGEHKYGDFNLPFKPIAQVDFSGGRGKETFEDDVTRYYDGQQVDTMRQGRATLGPQPHYCKGYRNMAQAMPGDVAWRAIYGSYRYITRRFEPPMSFTCAQVEIIYRKVGSPGALTVGIDTDNGSGQPSSTIDTDTLSASGLDILAVQGAFSVTASLNTGTNYHILVFGAATDNAANHWEIAVDTSVSGIGYSSSDHATWAAYAESIYYRATVADDPFIAHFYEYKGALYFATQPDAGTAGKIYLNGWRGPGQSNAADKTYLYPGHNEWATNRIAGAVAKLVGGTGFDENQNWRSVTGSDGNGALCSPDWNVTQDTTTEYVILGTDEFFEEDGDGVGTGITAPITDVAVVNNQVFFAQGEQAAIRKHESHRGTGSWSAAEYSSTGVYGRLMKVVNDPISGAELWWSRDTRDSNYRAELWHDLVPKEYNRLQLLAGTLLDTFLDAWDEQVVTNVTADVQANRTHFQVKTGVMATAVIFGAGTGGGGSGYSVNDILSLTLAGATTAKVKVTTIKNGAIATVDGTPAAGGLGYTPGDVLTLAGGTGGTVTVNSIGGGGAVTSVSQTADGSGYTTGVKATSGGTGAGCTINILGVYNGVATAITIDTAGAGYTAGTYSTTGGTGSGCQVTITVTSFTTGIIGSEAIASLDVRYGTKVRFDIQSTIHLDAGDLQLLLDNTANCGSPVLTLDLPSLEANVTKTVEIDYDAADTAGAEAVISIGFQLTVDLSTRDLGGLTDIYLFGNGMTMYNTRPPVAVGENSDRINGLELYGDPETLWVFTEKSMGEVRNNRFTPVPLRELAMVADGRNGAASCVSNVYLYFSLLNSIERYYRQNMDDVGPNGDDGLPSNRQGNIAHMVSYPGGRVYAALDGGASGYSSVVCLSNGAWCEVYRAPRVGVRIRRLHVQPIPGQAIDRLWISQGSDVLWLPVSLNPEADSAYTYVHEAALTTGRIHGGMQDVVKLFRSLKLASKNLGATATIEAQYRTNTSTAWTTISTSYTTSPFQEVNLSSSYNVTGNWIQFRLILRTTDNATTPILYGWIAETLMRIGVKQSYSLTFRLADNDKDLQEQPEGPGVTGKAKLDVLDSWLSDTTPILMNSWSSYEDNIYVYSEPSPVRFLRKFTDPEGREVRVCQLTLIGL